MKSNDRTAVPHTCEKCFKTHQSEKAAVQCCEPGVVGEGLPGSSFGDYGCGKCGIGWADFALAAKCCKADHIKCPLSELPDDAYIGHGLDYSHGKTFTGNWELVKNNGRHIEPVRVYPLPPLVAKMVEDLYRTRYTQGIDHSRNQMRDALGIPRENGNG